ncbi:type II toxin-antitoxin system PemK/MazF family toxin [Cellulomonas endophytica]|uniref:type II toxin-antitoxin system PemK/MazF family toxin n=1 Tax=Cellulomonas endophytica TaxID=2494735 RepID=UPI0010136BC8|nr:type II toxin-antitoxin system PemK/MazF family toxin [Cellulomonas endophytica]
MARGSWLGTAARLAGTVLGAVVRDRAARTTAPTRTRARPSPVRDAAGGRDLPGPRPGPARGDPRRPQVVYDPHPDGRPDPGEVVWAWVPYEDDPARGKDRPILLVGREGDRLLGLAMTSRDHDRDAADEARHGRVWVDVGSGAWDRQGRPSEVRVDRVLRLDPAAVRREGAVLPRPRFEAVARAMARSLRDRESW